MCVCARARALVDACPSNPQQRPKALDKVRCASVTVVVVVVVVVVVGIDFDVVADWLVDAATESDVFLFFASASALGVDDAALAQKYCGGGFGGYAVYLFASGDARNAFVATHPMTAKAIEPFVK